MDSVSVDRFMAIVERALSEGGCACPSEKPNKVYDVKDDRRALYVGKTKRDLGVRMREHIRHGVPWASQATTIECSCHASGTELVAEDDEISKECPRYNIRGVPEACRTKRLIDELAGA